VQDKIRQDDSAIEVGLEEANMLDARRRPDGRFFWLADFSVAGMELGECTKRTGRRVAKDDTGQGCRVPCRFDSGSRPLSTCYPISSPQFSRVFLTSAMNWSATAPSIKR